MNGEDLEKSSPSVTVAGGETHEAVGKVVVGNKTAELAAEERSVTHSTVPVALYGLVSLMYKDTNDSSHVTCDTYNNSLGKESSEVVVIVPANTLNGKSNVGSWNSVVTETNLRADELWLALLLGSNSGRSRRWGSRGQVAKVLLSKFDKGIMFDTASTNKDSFLGQVVRLNVVDKIFTLNALNVLLGSENCAAKRLALEGSRMQVVEDNFLATEGISIVRLSVYIGLMK